MGGQSQRTSAAGFVTTRPLTVSAPDLIAAVTRARDAGVGSADDTKASTRRAALLVTLSVPSGTRNVKCCDTRWS